MLQYSMPTKIAVNINVSSGWGTLTRWNTLLTDLKRLGLDVNNVFSTSAIAGFVPPHLIDEIKSHPGVHSIEVK